MKKELAAMIIFRNILALVKKLNIIQKALQWVKPLRLILTVSETLKSYLMALKKEPSGRRKSEFLLVPMVPSIP